MAATLSIKEANGATPTNSTITNARFCTEDSSNPGTSNPMVKPDAGNNYSYWKHIFLNADTSPSSIINNVKFYTDGTIGWTGVTLNVSEVTNYDQATGTEGTTGDEASANHLDTPTMVDASTYTSASPLSITGSINNPDTGKINTGYLLMQATVDTGAGAGALNTETMTYRYDEV